MKRFFIIVTVLANCSSLFAQSSISDLYKQWMIEDINKGSFEKAAQEMTHVTEWSFDEGDEQAYIDIVAGLKFLDYTDSVNLNIQATDSLALYIAKVSNAYMYYFYNNGDYNNAIECQKLIIEINKSVLGENHPDYATLLNNLGVLYGKSGDYVKEEQYYLEALKLRKSVLGENHLDYASSLSNLGVLYDEKGDYVTAEKYLTQALKIQKSVLGENHPDYATSLSALGVLYHHMGDYSRAEFYYLESLKILKSVLGENHPDYANSLNNLGGLYSYIGDYAKAEYYYLETIKIRKVVIGDHHPDYAMSLYSLGLLYDHIGDYVKAEQYLTHALQIQESVLGENHPNYAISLNGLGALYREKGDYAKAEKYYLKALKIYRSVLGDNHPMSANLLNGLGALYYELGDYFTAEQYLTQALKIQKIVLGENHPDYENSLHNLGVLYGKLGDYVKEEQYLTQALNICKSVLGENHPDYANSLNNLGGLYSYIGDYAKAEYYYLEAIKTHKVVIGDNHPDYATSLANLGVLYHHMGDYPKAEQYLTQALKIRKSVLGENHPDYASSLNNLGGLFKDMGNYTASEQYYTQALKIRKSVLGENNSDYALSLDNLGGWYYDIGDYAKAEQYCLEALKIRKSVLGENHPDYAGSLNNLGVLYKELGDYCKAEQYHLEALNIKKSIFGENHSDYALSLNNLGVLYKNMGDYSKAESYYTQAMQIYRNKFLQSVGFMTEQQRNKYWETMNGIFTITYPGFFCAYYPEEPSAASFAYNNELFVKGLLLNSSEAVKQSVLESGDTALVHKWNELTGEKSIIMTLQEKNSASDQIGIHEKRAEQLEKEITLSSSAYREEQRLWNITWDSVRSHLAPDQVAIEYMVAPLNKDSIIYCALLLRDTCSRPVMIPLFNLAELTALVNTDAENLTGNTYSFKGNGSELSRKVWGRIFPYIKLGETVCFAPSGLLHQLAIESLPYDSTHTMADMFNLVRLSSTREIVSGKSNHTHTTASLYGGIQYTMTGDELLAANEHYAAATLSASRGIINDTLDRGRVKPLPGTKKEVEDIYQMLEDNKLTVQLFTTKNANEESFKALSGKRQNILHVATHGFYWSDSTAHKKEYFSQRMLMPDDKMPSPPAIDPLNRCGLLFAGANTALSGHSKDLPEGVQDGILTAKEISLLDLRGADLAVLSACETGKGEITGEGVFGLQRAFKQAGVQTIIMSLWPVNDAATLLLMTEFYKNWITDRQSKREAFRNAQNTVRTQFEEPVYWAGFIMLD